MTDTVVVGRAGSALKLGWMDVEMGGNTVVDRSWGGMSTVLYCTGLYCREGQTDAGWRVAHSARFMVPGIQFR